MATKIEWADEVWNPVTGCTPVSEGCAHCYAKRMASRLRGRYGYPADEPFRVTVHDDRMAQPISWRKHRRVFVCSMGDLFHQDVDAQTLGFVFAMMSLCRRHTFMVLTKRPGRMHEMINGRYLRIETEIIHRVNVLRHGLDAPSEMEGWPLPNVWLGVTAENQTRADERIRVLLETPAARRFVSVEPMLGAVDLLDYMRGYGRFYSSTALDWVICGAETGPGARPMNLDWARDLRDQCVAARVPFFFKRDSDGNRELDGRMWEQYPTG